MCLRLLPGLAAFGSVFRAGEENADVQIQSAVSPQSFLLSLRPLTDESPSKEINHQHPAACSPTKASQRFRPSNSAWPLTARSILRSLPGKFAARRTSQNRSPQS